jgi:hypothetical protein
MDVNVPCSIDKVHFFRDQPFCQAGRDVVGEKEELRFGLAGVLAQM